MQYKYLLSQNPAIPIIFSMLELIVYVRVLPVIGESHMVDYINRFLVRLFVCNLNIGNII